MKILLISLFLITGCSSTPQEKQCINYCSDKNLSFVEALDSGDCICKKKPREIRFPNR